MARGSLAKEIVFKKILETFEDSFMYNGGKECRIPIDENGTPIQIKVTLTAAKDNVSPTGEVVEKSAAAPKETGDFMNFPAPKKRTEVTEEEKQNVSDLLKALGLD
jgi:hypothetical protein